VVLLREDLSGLGTTGPCNNVIINVCRDRGHFDLEYQAVMMERGGGGERGIAIEMWCTDYLGDKINVQPVHQANLRQSYLSHQSFISC
jgi:hypothetical protein